MGAHRKPSRIRLSQAVPAVAAAPTLASVAAAFLLSQQAPASAAQLPAARPASPDAAAGGAPAAPRLSAAQVQSASRQALLTAMRQAQPAKAVDAAAFQAAEPVSYTVRAGDSLSAIAGRVYHNPGAWPVLYWSNRGQVRWADMIEPGQVLKVPAEPATIPAPPAQLDPPAAAAAPNYTPRHASTATVQAQSAPAQPQAQPQDPDPAQTWGPAQNPAAAQDSAPPQHSAPAQNSAPASASVGVASSSSSGPYPGGAFGQCVVARESGGDAQITNASGHYGLYQFSASTWAEYGGNSADFGHASVAEQNQVFATALAQGGEFNWAPYDGC